MKLIGKRKEIYYEFLTKSPPCKSEIIFFNSYGDYKLVVSEVSIIPVCTD